MDQAQHFNPWLDANNDPDGCGLMETPGDASAQGFGEGGQRSRRDQTRRLRPEKKPSGASRNVCRRQSIRARRGRRLQSHFQRRVPPGKVFVHGTEIISEPPAFGWRQHPARTEFCSNIQPPATSRKPRRCRTIRMCRWYEKPSS